MRFIIIVFSLSFLTACVFGNLAQLKLLDPEANDFESSLSAEYLAYASSESEQGRPLVAEYFAGKGMRAWHGETVAPEMVVSSTPKPLADKLQATRALLLALLVDDVTRVVPQQAARAQLLFDCWVKAGQRKKDTGLCADELQPALDTLEEVADSLGFIQTKSQIITFSPGRSVLSKLSGRRLDSIAIFVRGNASYDIILEGSEVASPKAAALLHRRLTEIRRAFRVRGIPEAHIRVKAEPSEKRVYLSSDKAMKDNNQVTVTARLFKRGKEEEK